MLVLTDDNFFDAVDEHEILLVEFYAPWCGHCKNLAPHYEKAATALKPDDIYLAKVDATEEKTMAEKYGVRGFPSLKLFRGMDSVADYEAGRTERDIVAFMKKKAGPAVKILSDVDATSKFIESEDFVVVGFYEDLDSIEYKVFQKFAGTVDDASFGAVVDEAAAAKYEVASIPSIVLFKKYDEGKIVYDGGLTDTKGLRNFVKEKSLPSVIEFSQEMAKQIFGGPLEKHYLVFVDKSADYFERVKEDLATVAAANGGKALHVYVPHTEDRVMDYFGFNSAVLPSVMAVDMGGADMKKFHFTGEEDNLENMMTFAKSFHAGELKPFLKSAAAEDDSDEHVKVIVGSSFDERVMENEIDVLLEFYAPWCGHCKALAPKFEELGEKFAAVESILVAKMDATENEIDHPKVEVKGFPTLVFFPGFDKKHPVVYDGAREVGDMAEYLKKHANTKFDLDGEAAGGSSTDEL